MVLTRASAAEKKEKKKGDFGNSPCLVLLATQVDSASIGDCLEQLYPT